MKNFWVSHPSSVPWLAAVLLWPGSVFAYDSPDFEFDAFSSDGIFLPAEQQSGLLEALAATASNFTGNPRVDDDLREKALAIALRLDPMHYNSRLAHRELAKGTSPAATAYFDSLTMVSETLWSLAKQLSSPPLQPEGGRLAPYLMELSLITHPEPPSERIDLYAASTEGKYPAWEKFTTLQPDANRSTSRTLSVRSEANALLKNRAGGDRPEPPPMTGGNSSVTRADKGTDGTPPTSPARPAPSGPIAASLALAASLVHVDGTPVAGRVSLTTRPPNGPQENSLLARALRSPPPPDLLSTVPLVSAAERIQVEEVYLPVALSSERSWTWPVGVVGEVGFTPSGQTPAGRPTVLVQAAILVESHLKGKPINEDFVFSGEVHEASADPVMGGDPAAAAKAAEILGKKYFLLPASAREPLLTSLKRTGHLALLFRTELISYSSIPEALDLALSPTNPALVEASAAFDEIEAVSARMSFPELSRNAKVQERLEAILVKYPSHLSARAMLEYGRLPVTQEMKISEFAGQIEALVEPFVNLGDVEDTEGAKAKLAEADQQLARLRLEAPAEARALIPPASNLLATATTYLNLPARDTAIALQRLDEISDSLVLLKSWLSALGVQSGLMVPGVSDPVVIEGESLVENSEVTGGKTTVQELGSNGSLFSEDRQLWWTDAGPGDISTIRIDGVEPGRKTVTLFMTTARDYGIARISIGNLFKEIDFYARSILITDPIVFENIELDPGEPLTITLEIIGTNPDAEPRYYLGVDRIEVK